MLGSRLMSHLCEDVFDHRGDEELVILDAVALVLGQRAQLVTHANCGDGLGPCVGFLGNLTPDCT